ASAMAMVSHDGEESGAVSDATNLHASPAGAGGSATIVSSRETSVEPARAISSSTRSGRSFDSDWLGNHTTTCTTGPEASRNAYAFAKTSRTCSNERGADSDARAASSARCARCAWNEFRGERSEE